MTDNKNIQAAVPANEASEAGRVLNDPKSTPSELSKAGETLQKAKDEGVLHHKLFGA